MPCRPDCVGCGAFTRVRELLAVGLVIPSETGGRMPTQKIQHPLKGIHMPGTPKPKLPPLKALLALKAPPRHGSFSQGAEELGVTPSAVSHHIQQLEDFLGVPLFQRHAGRATLTSAGRTYAAEIERGFGLISDATNLVAPQSQSGHLVIASGPSFAAKWLQPRISGFLAANPGVR